MKYDLKPRQIALFMLAFFPIIKMFTMGKSAAEAANEDMWISVLLNLAIDFLTILALIWVDKKHNATFYEILEENFGKIVAKIVLSIYFIYFMLKAFTPLFEQRNFVQNSFYGTSLTTFSFAPFFILAIYICCQKLRAIGRLADIMWIMTLISVLMILALSVESTDLGAIFPIGANGVGILKGYGYIIPWFTDASYFLFMIGYFKKERHGTAKILWGFIGHALLTLAFSVIFYCVFTFVASREIFPLAEMAKYSSVINSIGRFDYIAILFMLISNGVAIALPMYFATRILKKIIGIEKTWIPALIVNGLQLITATFLERYQQAIITFIHLDMSAFMLILGNIIPVLLLFIKPKKEKLNEIYKG